MWTRGWGKLGGLAYIHLCQHCSSLSRVLLFVTPWTVAHQAPLSMEFSRQEYWRQLPFPSPGDLPDPGIEPGSPALQGDSVPSKLVSFQLILGLESASDLSLISWAHELNSLGLTLLIHNVGTPQLLADLAEMMPVELLSWLRVQTVTPSFYFRKTKQAGIMHTHRKDRIGALCLLQD